MMTAFAADPTITMAEARDRYFAENDFGPDGGYEKDWVDFKFGPIPMPIPNTPSRKRAVPFHDLHHVLTGYATDLFGEYEISAWELGSGCKGVGAAWVLNLSGMFGGALMIPRRTWRAFLRGRRSQNLYEQAYDDALLARRVGELRTSLGIESAGTARARRRDVAVFAEYLVAGAAIGLVLFVGMIPIAIVANVNALVRRRSAAA